jgi:F-type H+-transporting ATPase subunit c
MKTKMLFITIAMMFLAVPMFAQGGGAPAALGGLGLPAAAGCLAMAIASGLCALGQGKAVAGAAEGMARNPGAAPAIRFALILGLALIESLSLYTLVVVFKVIS